MLLLANFQRLFALTRGRCLYDPFVNPFCFCRGTKIVTFRRTDRVKKTNNSLTSSARASVRSLRKTTGTISPRVLLSSSSPESSIFCSSSSRARQTSRLGSFSLIRFARGRGERHLGILSLSLSLSTESNERTNRTNERAKEREREFSLSDFFFSRISLSRRRRTTTMTRKKSDREKERLSCISVPHASRLSSFVSCSGLSSPVSRLSSNDRTDDSR